MLHGWAIIALPTWESQAWKTEYILQPAVKFSSKSGSNVDALLAAVTGRKATQDSGDRSYIS